MVTLFAAAGKGRRLGAAGTTRPKCMFAAGSKTILEWLISFFHDAGSDHIVCVVGHCGNVIRETIGDGSAIGVRVTYLEEPSGAGNAYCVRGAQRILSTPFFYSDADILFHPSLPELLRQRAASTNADAVLAYGRPRSIAPTHKSAAAFQQALTHEARILGIDINDFCLMGVNVLAGAIRNIINDLPHHPDHETSLSDVLLQHERSLHIEYAYYNGPWWHLAYPQDLDALPTKLTELQLA